jgi:(2R)-3-sulfolactate dehydrogenase (NADP+)
MMQQTRLTLDEVYQLSLRALNACGANEASATSLARATAAAEAEGLPNVGLSHLLDYLGSLRRGQINGQAVPVLKRNGPSSLLVEGDAGIAHLAFDIAFSELTDAARVTGIAALAVRNVFTCGVVGYFVERIAREGLVGQAYANAPAMVAPWGGAALPFFGTNPIAFGVPIAGRSPLIIDQSTTITAFVNIRNAAHNKQPIPSAWAFDTSGRPTNDAEEALKGTVAPSGGYKGTNLALMVDVLAAGLSGANWSYQAPEFGVGNEPVNVGQFFVAIDPALFCGADFSGRMAEFIGVYEKEFNGHVPGDARQKHRQQAEENGVGVDAEVLEKIRNYI